VKHSYVEADVERAATVVSADPSPRELVQQLGSRRDRRLLRSRVGRQT